MTTTAAQTKPSLATIDALVQKATVTQRRLNTALNKVLDYSQQAKAIDEVSVHTSLEKILQLRLDTQDVIQLLLHLNRNLCQALGINPQNTVASNLDRAAYAIGDLALKQELHSLNDMIHELRQAKEIAQKEQKTMRLQQRLLKRIADNFKHLVRNKFYYKFKPTKVAHHARDVSLGGPRLSPHLAIAQGIEHELQEALELQANFYLSIEQLTEAFQHYEGIPRFGHIYDYMAGLKGPINYLHQGMQHGLDTVAAIHAQFQIALGLTPSLQNTPASQALRQTQLQIINKLTHELHALNLQNKQQLNTMQQQLSPLQNMLQQTQQLQQHPPPIPAPEPKPEPENKWEEQARLARTLQLKPHP